MKIAIDVHGTYDADPERFDRLINNVNFINGPVGKAPAIEFYIFSGAPVIDSEEFIHSRIHAGKLNSAAKNCIKYLSVVDFMKEHGFPMVQKSSGRTGRMSWYFDGPEEVWWSLKAVICRINEIDVIIDDKYEYGYYFSPLGMRHLPGSRYPTVFVHYQKTACRYLDILEETVDVSSSSNAIDTTIKQ